MEKTDKAVATEDLYVDAMYLQASQLEAVFKTLVDNKVEAIKNDRVRTFSAHSSPKSLMDHLRIVSSSSPVASLIDNSNYLRHSPNRRRRLSRKGLDEDDAKRMKRSGHSKSRISSSSPESPRYRIQRCCEGRSPFRDEEEHDNLEFVRCDSVCSGDDCVNASPNTHPCCCPNEGNGQIKVHCNDYVSLKIEDYEDDDAIIDRDALRRARRKRRKRRKRRMKRHLEITPVPVPEVVREIDPEELPQRARWTIVATACLLLFMCLLLVGVTLRMAPIIDDMVRKENEELMNSLHREPSGHHSTNLNRAQPVE